MRQAVLSARGRRLPIVINGELAFGLLIALIVLAWVVAPDVFAPHDPYRINIRDQFKPPSAMYLFGADEAGRDILSRVIHGARYSVLLSIAIILTVALIGSIIGAVSGLAGGRTDEMIMRVVDIFMSFPNFVLAMTIAASVGRNLGSAALGLILVWWPSYARMVRGLVLSLKQNQFFEAATALGTPRWRTMLWHVLPHITKELNARVSVDIGRAILSLAGLNFLGLGAQPPTPEWGLLIANSRQYLSPAWWYPTFPGLVLFVVIIGFTLLGDALYEEIERRGTAL